MSKLKELAKWSKIIGLVILVGGIISAISGLFAFLIGAIPGIVTAFLGWKLIKASENATQLAANSEDLAALDGMVANLTSYFKIQGILLCISFALMIIGVVFSLSMVGGMIGGVVGGMGGYPHF